jgi:hypothetical protein
MQASFQLEMLEVGLIVDQWSRPSKRFDYFCLVLNSLGPSIFVSALSNSNGLDEVCEDISAGHSDQIIDLDDSQQRGGRFDIYHSDTNHESTATHLSTTSKRRLNSEDADFSHLPLKRHAPMEVQESYQTPATHDKPEIVELMSSREDDSEDRIHRSSSVDPPEYAFRMVDAASEVRFCVRLYIQFDER